MKILAMDRARGNATRPHPPTAGPAKPALRGPMRPPQFTRVPCGLRRITAANGSLGCVLASGPRAHPNTSSALTCLG